MKKRLVTAKFMIQDAENILKQYSCQEFFSTSSEFETEKVRDALLLLVQESEYQMLGICANSMTEGLTALEQYLKALGYPVTFDMESLAPVEGAVYIKFNGRSQGFYVSPYLEKYRGVLVSCQSTESNGVNGTYGHFPLDLFA